MRANFRADAVLERRDDFSARRVIVRIRREDQQHVERHAHRIALNLNVAFLHDVEQADLNFSGQVGQFVHGEDAAIGARQQAIVNREFVAQGAARARRLDRVHVAKNVRDGHVRRRQLFDEARVARQPRDGRGVALFRDQIAARAAQRRQRIVVNFATGDVGNFLIQKVDQARAKCGSSPARAIRAK